MKVAAKPPPPPREAIHFETRGHEPSGYVTHWWRTWCYRCGARWWSWPFRRCVLSDSAAYTSRPDGWRTDGVALRRRSVMTKKEASLRLQIIAAEIALTLDADNEDCPSWPDDLTAIAKALYDGGE